MARIFCIANQKGGVGKTTTTVNLAAGLGQIGRRVLVVDLDPQGNATMGSGIDKRALELTVYDVLLGNASIVEARSRSAKAGYDVLGANRELAGAEVELVDLDRRNVRLRDALVAVADDYDFVLIDCPPSLSMLTLNGLCSAHGVVVPMQCEYFALEGLSDLVNTIKQVHANLNPALEIIGLLRVMFDPRITLQQQVSDQLKTHFGDKVFDTVIPRNVRLAEAPSYGLPGVVFDPASKGAQAFVAFAKEMATRARPTGDRVGGGLIDQSTMTWGTLADVHTEGGAGLSRIEDASLNASAVPQQRWIDGWLVRYSNGKPKRSRCINALAPGRLPFEVRLAAAERLFQEAGLPTVFRITPFSEPRGLDAELAERGWHRFDETDVMTIVTSAAPPPHPDRMQLRALDAPAFASLIGAWRGSPPDHESAHAARLGQSPVPFATFMLEADGQPVACGAYAIEQEVAGLYDLFTAPAVRRRGFADALCRRLLALAASDGAHIAYLQVEADNAAASALYRGLGFVDAYSYHYRTLDQA